MNPNKKSNFLKLLTVAAAVLACVLRAACYSLGIDGRGLPVRGHWANIGLWGVSAVFAAALLLLGLGITSSRKADRPQSAASAAGAFALGAALLVTSLQTFGGFSLTADLFIWVLGLCAGIAMLILGICRLRGKNPYFLLHALLCLYMTFRMISMYRRWSSDPQLLDYVFYLMAHAALTLAAYHHAAFDCGLGGHRPLWISSLASVYLCCAALPRCEDRLLMAAFALWAFTGLTVLPVRGRRLRPIPKTEERGEETL